MINKYFPNMPSVDNVNMRPTNISYAEFKTRFTSDIAKDLMKKYGICCGMNSASGITLITKYNDGKDELRLQQFLNEMDLHTDIYIRTVWAGNCGIFADKDVYDHCSVVSKKSAMFDTKYDFQKFYCVRDYLYNFNDSDRFAYREFNDYEWKIKNECKSTETKYDDVKNDILAYANEVAGLVNAYVKLVVGRHNYESNSVPYESFVVYKKGGNEPLNQLGDFKIKQNDFGDCLITESIPLCGYTEFGFDIDDYKTTISKVIYRIAS